MESSVVSAKPGMRFGLKTEGVGLAATWMELQDACSATGTGRRGQFCLQGPAVGELMGADGWMSCSVGTGLLLGR